MISPRGNKLYNFCKKTKDIETIEVAKLMIEKIDVDTNENLSKIKLNNTTITDKEISNIYITENNSIHMEYYDGLIETIRLLEKQKEKLEKNKVDIVTYNEEEVRERFRNQPFRKSIQLGIEKCLKKPK